MRNVPIDAFPDVTPAQVNIYTESPGLAAEDVEQLLTTPVESALAGLPKVQEIRSVSLFGLSYVSVYFEDDMDIYFARQLVNERLQEIGDRLPEGYGKPSMGPNTSGLGQVFWYTVERAPGVSKDQITDMDLRTWQDWTVRLILRTAPGVDDVTSWGGGEREYQVQIDPQRLYARGLGFARRDRRAAGEQRPGRRQRDGRRSRAIPGARPGPAEVDERYRRDRAQGRGWRAGLPARCRQRWWKRRRRDLAR